MTSRKAASKAAEPQRIALPAALGPAEAPALHADIAAKRGAPLALDASAVRRVGGQCAQILIAAAAAWAGDGHDFRLVEPSEEVSEALRLLGLDGLALTGEAA